MKTLPFKKNLLLLFIILLAFSCKKDDKEEGATKEFETIEFAKEEIINSLPDGLKNSDNQYAQDAVSWIESATDWSAFSEQLTPPEDAQQYGARSAESSAPSSYTWSWDYGTYSLSMLWEYSEDAAKKYWDLSIKYNSDTWYPYLEAWEAKTGIKGEIKYNFQWVCAYEQGGECPEFFWKYTWEKNASNAYVFNYIVESVDEEYESSINYKVVINENGSGSVNYYMMDALLYEITWDTAGNGTWAYYVGDFTQTGSWTAG